MYNWFKIIYMMIHNTVMNKDLKIIHFVFFLLYYYLVFFSELWFPDLLGILWRNNFLITHVYLKFLYISNFTNDYIRNDLIKMYYLYFKSTASLWLDRCPRLTHNLTFSFVEHNSVVCGSIRTFFVVLPHEI